MEQGGGPAARAKPSELVDRVDEDTYRTVSEEVQAIHVQLVDCAGKKSAAARELRRGGVAQRGGGGGPAEVPEKEPLEPARRASAGHLTTRDASLDEERPTAAVNNT